MNLPLFLDIAIGLIFIYLILSLLASEIQELVATVLQWRAKHLKESIENLLVGDNKKELPEMLAAKKLANQLYANPLIENVNQEATGLIVNLLRKPTWQLGKKYQLITENKETIFGNGKHTGPSYIPSETFATTLLETLKIPNLTHKFCEIKLCEFKNNLLIDIKLYLSGLKISEVAKDTLEGKIIPLNEPGTSIVKGFREFEQKLDKVCEDFKEQKSTLEISIQRIHQRLSEYSLTAKNWGLHDKYQTEFQEQIESLTKDFLDDNERKLIISRMNLSLGEIAKVFDKDSQEHQQILEEIRNIDPETFRQIKHLIDCLPKSVKESIFALAHRAQSKVDTLDKDINQLRKEIEVWFDRSMERASGVYKRNAKGVAILIGFLIAIVANADTFYIVNKLSTDRDLRNAITQNAEVVNTSCSNPTTLTAIPIQELTSATSLTSATTTSTNELVCVGAKTKAVLEEVPFPIGWSNNTLTDQLSLPYELSTGEKRTRQWNFLSWNADTIVKKLYPQYKGNLKTPKSNTDWFIWSSIHVLLPIIFFALFIYWGIKIIWKYQKVTTSTYIWFAFLSSLTTFLVVFTGVKVILGVLMGWFLSAVAISMGAPFWFDLLGKVINVRNTGPKPESSIKNQATSQDQKASTRSGT